MSAREWYERICLNKENCSWFDTYGFIPGVVENIRFESLIEVGVAYGYHSEYLLDRYPQLKYFGIDPYIPAYDPADRFGEDVMKLFYDAKDEKEAFDALFLGVSYGMSSNYKGRGTLIRMSSNKASQIFRDKSVDVVYIDGNHQYQDVLSDLEIWAPKVSEGGLLLGDDFDRQSVRAAVLAYTTKHKREVVGVTFAGRDSPSKYIIK
jgi:hypothetical protein